MRSATRIAVTCVLALVGLMALPPGAQAVGELTPAGCVDDNDTGPDVCAQAVNGLDAVRSVAVSPDGRSVYAASLLDHALVRFNRSTSGTLTSGGCIDLVGAADVCAQSTPGLFGPSGIAVSPDGRSVYVAAGFDDAITRFDRDSTGALTPAGCIEDNDSPPAPCARSVNGLQGATSIAVSPDGGSVYVAATNDNAIVRFNRDSSGTLTPAGCINDNDTVTDACAQSVNGLAGPTSVAVSPDGTSVYVASLGDHAVVRFNRSSTGALTSGGCTDDNDSGNDICTQTVDGLFGAVAVAASPDGRSVYVAAANDAAIVRFNRDTTGALTPAGCIDDNDVVGDTCAQSINGLQAAESVAVSPDGTSVYVASFIDEAVVRFARNSSGALSPGGCVDDNDTGPDVCGQSVNGLARAMSVATSPDGGSVYVAGQDDDAIVRFNRARL